MTRDQFLSALDRLGLTPAAKRTGDLLGLSVRQCQRIAAGQQDAPATVCRLLECYLRHGLPKKRAS